GLLKTASQAGMRNLRAFSVTLPAGSARSLGVTLDSKPASRSELTQMIEGKAERGLGQKISELRVNYRGVEGFKWAPQYLVSGVTEQVIAQYEHVFRQIGWQAGMITPQHIGEAQWLIRQDLEDDQVVVSVNDHGFAAVIVRGDEPLLVREVECAEEE